MSSFLSLKSSFAILVLLISTWPGTAAETPPPPKPEEPAIVYQWDATNWLTKYNPVQFTASPITNEDGSIGAKVVVSAHSALNPYNQVIVTGASLQGGQEYTVAVTFSVVEPTKFPGTFYIFARNSAGNQYDLWQTWIGLPGPTRTLTLPLNLKNIPGGKWQLTLGISKSGGLNLNRFVVYSGSTSNGKTPFATAAPSATSPAASHPPEGVTAATGYTPFTVTPPAEPKATLSTADYKLIADVPGAAPEVAIANADALQQAILAAKAAGAAKLVIPKGSYRLAGTKAVALNGLTDFRIDGQGSVLIFEKLTKDGPAVYITDCTRLVLENLTLDWDWNAIPIASLGVVSNLSDDKLQCDFTFPDLNAAQTKLTGATPWHGIFRFDPVALMKNDSDNYHVPKTLVIKPGSAGNVLHVTFPAPVTFVNGASYCIRHLYYEMGGFKVSGSTDVTFHSVNIFSIPGMGWFFGGAMKNFELIDCHILRAPGSRHPLTTAADGFHADQFIGNLKIENCSITGAGDDAMNLHNESYQGQIIRDPADPAKITLLACPSYQLRLGPGDPVEFYNADFSNPENSATTITREVASVASDNRAKPPQTTITFTSPVPDGLTEQSIVVNGRYETSNVLISNCQMVDTNGRGILLSAKNATIENCLFKHVYSTGINLESDLLPPLWTEGRGASNVLIKGNTFEDDNHQVRYNGAIIYTNTRIPWGPTTATLYDQITIENNRFINCPGPALSLSNCKNLLVRENEIKLTTALPDSNRYVGTFYITNSSQLSLGGNRWVNEVPETTTGIIYDPETTTGLSTETNAVTYKKSTENSVTSKP